MAFRAGSPFIGGLDRMFLKDILSDIGKGGIGNPNPLAATIPETVYICFQMTFAIITPTLIAGAFAERMKFSAMLWFIGLWAIFVYGPVAHWVWGPDGFLNSTNDAAWTKVLDFAGGTVVHVNSGVAGLMCALMLGPRRDTAPGHNVVLTFIGASLLWVGWFGVHAVGGATGAVLTGVFAVAAYGGTAGWIEGNGIQVINQIKGVLVVAIYDAIVSLIILKLVDIFIGLRVGKEIEVEGLD